MFVATYWFRVVLHHHSDWTCLYVLAPDAPRLFTINRKNVDTVHLEWGKPLEPNGILIGYQLKYQTGELLSNRLS